MKVLATAHPPQPAVLPSFEVEKVNSGVLRVQKVGLGALLGRFLGSFLVICVGMVVGDLIGKRLAKTSLKSKITPTVEKVIDVASTVFMIGLFATAVLALSKINDPTFSQKKVLAVIVSLSILMGGCVGLIFKDEPDVLIQ